MNTSTTAAATTTTTAVPRSSPFNYLKRRKMIPPDAPPAPLPTLLSPSPVPPAYQTLAPYPGQPPALPPSRSSAPHRTPPRSHLRNGHRLRIATRRSMAGGGASACLSCVLLGFSSSLASSVTSPTEKRSSGCSSRRNLLSSPPREQGRSQLTSRRSTYHYEARDRAFQYHLN